MENRFLRSLFAETLGDGEAATRELLQQICSRVSVEELLEMEAIPVWLRTRLLQLPTGE